jgi:Zn-dependent peptidase ImmA (M78 family)
MANPERVELVRQRLGLTKIGFVELLGIDRKRYQRFLAGADLPNEALDALCNRSGYSPAFFEKPAVQYPNAEAVSFRSLRSLTSGPRDAAIAASALAFEIDDWVSERYGLPEHDLPQITDCPPAEAAALLRARWGLGIRPIKNLINQLELHGVRVFSLVEETRHLDAYSFWRNDKPYVFLNTLKTAEHSRFDAAHELGHLVMHRRPTAPRDAEREADAFASAFLMPPADLAAEIPFVRSLRTLIDKKARWGVSVAALNYSLHKLGRVSDWNYRSFCIELSKLGRENEPNPMPRETSQIWQKVLTDLWKKGLSLSRIAKQLEIPEREINSLLFGIAASPVPPNPAPGSLRTID